MTDLSYWAVFFGAALALNLSPGPDLLYVISRTIAQGTKVERLRKNESINSLLSKLIGTALVGLAVRVFFTRKPS
jgi:threonine/homoserine/homoserine lactone efflux protein